MLNNVNLQGRFTADPQIRIFNTGIAVARFTLANETGYKDDKGNKIVNFIPCIAWRNTAENIGKYYKKGDLAIAEGELSTRTYEKDGVRQYITEINVRRIHFSESKKKQEEVNKEQSFMPPNDDPEKIEKEIAEMQDEELPF